MTHSIENIQTLIIDKKKEFKNKELLVYLYSVLEINNIDYSSNTFLHLNLLENISQYQIILFNKSFDFTIIDIFKSFYTQSSKKHTTDVFLCDKFFAIYKNQEFYYVQKIDYEINMEDLEKYISKMLKIKIDNTYKIDSNDLLDLEIKYQEEYKKTYLINLNNKTDNSFKLYSLYLILCLSLSFLYYLYDLKNKNDLNILLVLKNKKQYEEFIKTNIFNGIQKELLVILDNLNKYKLKLKSFEYKKNYISLSFESRDKDNIYAFLDTYKKRIDKSDITSDLENKIFRCLCDVKIYR